MEDTSTAGTQQAPERKVIIPQTCRIRREMRFVDDETISERVGGITTEFIKGFQLLQKYDLAATFFGSARCGLDTKLYQDATELARRLSQAGFAIITGGAAGVMEAANRGAKEAGGHSIGISIELPMEQAGNDYTTDSEHFDHFFTRKVMLTFASEVYIYFPGGFGTLDEFFEIVTLIQTKKIENIPVVLIGKEYWAPLIAWMKECLLKQHHTISEGDLDIFTLVDSIDEAYETVMNSVCEV